MTFEALLTCTVLKSAVLVGDSREEVVRNPSACIVTSEEIEVLSLDDVEILTTSEDTP